MRWSYAAPSARDKRNEGPDIGDAVAAINSVGPAAKTLSLSAVSTA
jgi:hypothetical protein